MANKKGNPNIREISKGTQFQTGSKQVETARKGGQASQRVQAENRTYKELATILADLPPTDSDKAVLQSLGIAEENMSNKMLHLVYLHRRMRAGDPAAIKLFLEITGEAPTAKMEITDRSRSFAFDAFMEDIENGKKGNSE